MSSQHAPAPDAARRGEQILAVFDTAFAEPLAADPAALRGRLRKMAASAADFYRGTACLFYRDLAAGHGARRDEKEGAAGVPAAVPYPGRYLDERTSRVWIHGDLHTGAFGTYLDATGRLVFHAGGFDEAYVGPFLWDLQRFAASVALLGHAKALSDAQITGLVRTYAAAYRERIHALAADARRPGRDELPPLTLDTAEGPLLDTLRAARARTRGGLLETVTEVRDFERRFSAGAGTVELDAAARYKVLAAFDGYLETLPESSLAHPDAYRVKDVVGRHGTGPAGTPPTTSSWRAAATPWRAMW